MPNSSLLTELQLRAISSPARVELLRVLVASGPLSATGLARQLGRKVKGLYYHLQALEAVGLVKVKETRKAARRDEAVYEAVRYDLDLDSIAVDPSSPESTAETISALLRYTDREIQRAYTAANIDPELMEFIEVLRGTAALREKTAMEIRGLLRQVIGKLQSDNTPGEARRFGLTVVFAPITPTRVNGK